MVVKVFWAFDVDISDFDPEFVEIEGLAIDLTKKEVQYLLDNEKISAEDLAYEVIK